MPSLSLRKKSTDADPMRSSLDGDSKEGEVRNPTTWTTLLSDGTNHLGMCCNALPGHQIAVITSGCAPSRVRTTSTTLYPRTEAVPPPRRPTWTSTRWWPGRRKVAARWMIYGISPTRCVLTPATLFPAAAAAAQSRFANVNRVGDRLSCGPDSCAWDLAAPKAHPPNVWRAPTAKPFHSLSCCAYARRLGTPP